MGNFRSTPPPGALKEGSTKPESISPRRGKTPPEPVIQSALEQEKIQALKEIFIKMKSSPEQRTVSEEEFLRFISVPEILQPFAKKFFSAICKTQIIPAAPTNTKKKAAAHHRGNNNNTDDNNGLQANTSFDLVQFVRAIEICFRGTNIDQVTFLFSGYEEDFVMNRSQEGSLEVETKRRVKISDLRDMLQDSGVLSFYNKEYEDYLEAVAIMLAAQQQQAGTFQPHPDEMEPSLSSEEEDIPNKETKPSEDAEKKENTSENNDNKEGASNNNEEKIQNVENNENPNNEEDNNNNTNEPKKPSATIGHNVFAKMADAMISSVKSDQQKHGQGNSDEYISLEIFLDWVMENTPSLTKAVENFVQLKFLREVTKSNQTTSWIPMMLNMDKSKIYDHSLLWALTSALDGKKSSWKLLYSTTQHGQSLNRLAHHVSSYNGPSLILIRNTKREVFGAYVTHVWRTTSSFQGDAECFLFSFTPNFNVYRSTGVEKNYAYLFTTKNTFSNFPVGLGFGGTTKQFRLYVDDDLLKGESRASCTTYRPGTLSSDVLFEVLQIEVWGCGGNAADEAQATARKRNEKHLEKRRKVNRKMMADGGWENSADKFLMDLVGKTGHSDAYMEEIRKAKADKNKE